MKKITLMCCMIIGSGMAAFAQTDTKPEFKFVSEKYDFGKVPKGKPVTTKFEFTNVGEAPLILAEVRSTCSCIVADYSKTAVTKGAKGVISVTYDAAAVGVFNKSIVITSNAKTPQKVIIISGDVITSP